MMKPVDHNRPDATLLTPSTETPRKRHSEVESQPAATPNDVVLTPDNAHQRQRAPSLDSRDVAQRLAEPVTKRQKTEPPRLLTPPNLPADVDSRELSLAFVRHGYKVGQAPGVTQAMRAFCPQEPNATAVRTIREAFARVESEGNLPQFLHICQGMRLNNSAPGLTQAFAIKALSEQPLLAWPVIARGTQGAWDPQMKPDEASDLIRALAKLTPYTPQFDAVVDLIASLHMRE